MTRWYWLLLTLLTSSCLLDPKGEDPSDTGFDSVSPVQGSPSSAASTPAMPERPGTIDTPTDDAADGESSVDATEHDVADGGATDGATAETNAPDSGGPNDAGTANDSGGSDLEVKSEAR